MARDRASLRERLAEVLVRAVAAAWVLGFFAAVEGALLRGCARRVQAVASRLSMRRIAAMPIIVSEVCTRYS